MHSSAITQLPDFYKGYVAKLEDLELMEALEDSLQGLRDLPLDKLEELNGTAYFPGKWTVNEVLQHLLDTERIMANRALAIARQEQQALPGFDQDAYVANSNANERPIEDMLLELKIQRQSTILLFRSFSPADLLKSGTANDLEIDVLALGFIIPGHEKHHLGVLERLYFPLLDE